MALDKREKVTRGRKKKAVERREGERKDGLNEKNACIKIKKGRGEGRAGMDLGAISVFVYDSR